MADLIPPFLPAEAVRRLEAEGTDAYRIWSGADGWIERYGPVVVLSSRTGAFTPMREAAERWATANGFRFEAILGRRLVQQPRASDRPELLAGRDPGRLVVRESGLRYEVEPAAGYSSGLFIDQRANRRFLRELQPRRVLNLFAYTCSFTVAAVAGGTSETLSIDLSRAALEQGLRNLDRNGFPRDGHRVIADDVSRVLPRLERRGEQYDAIILDPPTFARRGKAAPFRVEEALGDLMEACARLTMPGGWLLASTNSRALDLLDLETHAHAVESRQLLATESTAPLPDVDPAEAPATLWLQWGSAS